MKNLFKTLITVITVVCMLVTCTTAFAATANTVTQYNADNNVTVTSTVSGVAKDTIVTYLAAQDTDGQAGIQANEIKFIDQKTSEGSDSVMTFRYSIDNGDTDWTPGTTITQVKYGSGDSAVATALNADATKDVVYNDINVTVTVNSEAIPNAYTKYVTLSSDKLGNGETKNIAIDAAAGYEINSIKINGVDKETTASTHEVTYGQTVVVDVKPTTTVKVYLLNAEVSDNVEVYDADDMTTPLKVVSGVGYFTGPATKVGIQFNKNIDGAHGEGYYEAVAPASGAQSGYFAVQLAGTEDDMADVTTQKAYAEDAEGTKTLSE